ncbi:hypothetical protein [Campylobacter insulaenigrae]|uniref:hypothetical protein n=1 Tax=Campylobacter insulaenigrae TaxID=260714 RepID=UPI0024319BFF|nr:hypothetical protein [Campylobacter insulaenigrae]
MKIILFYVISFLFYIVLFNLSNESNMVIKIIIILLSLFIGVYWIKKRKIYSEEIIIFFFFPIIFSEIFYNIIFIFYDISNTESLILDLLIIPLSNFIYAYISVKRKELTIDELSHLVTFIRCILFISTILGFILKNPLFLDGVLSKIEVEFIDISLKVKLTDYIITVIQSTFVPYLISATFIKGFIELKKFKNKYNNK